MDRRRKQTDGELVSAKSCPVCIMPWHIRSAALKTSLGRISHFKDSLCHRWMWRILSSVGEERYFHRVNSFKRGAKTLEPGTWRNFICSEQDTFFTHKKGFLSTIFIYFLKQHMPQVPTLHLPMSSFRPPWLVRGCPLAQSDVGLDD